MNDQLSPSQSDVPPMEIEEDRGLDLGRLIGIVSEARWLVLGIAAGVFALGTLYAFLKTPVYETYSNVLVLTKQSGGLNGLEQLSSLIEGSSLPTQTEIQLLQTRAVIVPVVDKLHLNIQVGSGPISIIGSLLGWRDKPNVQVSAFKVPTSLEGEAFTVEPTGGGGYRLLDPDGNLVLQGGVGRLAAGRVETEGSFWVVNLKIDSMAAGTGKFALARIPADQAVASILSNLSVTELGLQTGIVQVRLRGTSPDLITRELNEIAKQNVGQNARRSAVQAANQLQFLKAQLPGIEKQVQATQKKLSDFLSTHRTLVFSQDANYLTSQASTLEQQITPLEAQIAEARAALGARNPRLTTLEAQLSALKQQREQLFSSLTKLPKDQQTLIRLQSDATISQNLYQAILNQTQALQIAQAGAVGDVVVVDPAAVPMIPVQPNRPLVLALSLVLGLFLGVGAALGRRALNKGIEDPEVLDMNLGLPVYAVIAHSVHQHRMERERTMPLPGEVRLLTALSRTTDATSEGLRSLRTAIQLALPQKGPHILCFSSLGPGEGKSFVTSNLAFLFAQSGSRVLLVDADLRRGHIHRLFGLPRGPGLSELLAGKMTLEQVVRKGSAENLHVVTTGALPEDAAILLLNSDLEAMIGQLSSVYNLIIIDVPPVLAVSDAFVVARQATFNLLLLKHGLHSERQVQLVKKRFERHGVTLVGSILNDISAAARRYAYHQYGYQYHYEYKPGEHGL